MPAHFGLGIFLAAAMGCGRDPAPAAPETPVSAQEKFEAFTGGKFDEVWAHKGSIYMRPGGPDGPEGMSSRVGPEPDGWTYFWIRGKEPKVDRIGNVVVYVAIVRAGDGSWSPIKLGWIKIADVTRARLVQGADQAQVK